MLKKILYGLVFLFITLGGFVFYITRFLPGIAVDTAFKVQSSAEKVARGKYMANAVMVCTDCHSERDYSKFSGPLVSGTEGQGGEVFDQGMGFPGRYVAKNITPAALQDWSDGELLRAITSGVGKMGEPLFSIMPHHNYGQLDLEDIEAVIAYIRTLPPKSRANEASASEFPMNIIIHTIPKSAQFKPRPNKTNKVAYGKYMFTAASCDDCHTQKVNGKPVAGMYLAGGFAFRFKSGGTTYSANLTPDNETGIGKMTEDEFVRRFKQYNLKSYTPEVVKAGQFNSPMPWTMYAHMKEEDLRAIFAYLKTVKPVKNRVVRFKPAKT